MYYAIDEENNRIHIKSSQKGKKYYCPCCRNELVRKVGRVKAHHFAHMNGVCDGWYSENKGPWHVMMQDCFDKENQEVVVKSRYNRDEYHIADILLEGNYKDTIIEFQHSPMSNETFDIRNKFYRNNGLNKKYRGNGKYVYDKNRVIWVFDYRDRDLFINVSKDLKQKSGIYWWRNKNKVGFDNYAKITWNRPAQTFGYYDIEKDKDITVFLCVNYREYYQETNFSEFYTEDAEHKMFTRTKNVFCDSGSDELYFVKLEYTYKDNKYCGGPIMNLEGFIQYVKNIDEYETKMLGYEGFYPYNEELITKSEKVKDALYKQSKYMGYDLALSEKELEEFHKFDDNSIGKKIGGKCFDLLNVVLNKNKETGYSVYSKLLKMYFYCKPEPYFLDDFLEDGSFQKCYFSKEDIIRCTTIIGLFTEFYDIEVHNEKGQIDKELTDKVKDNLERYCQNYGLIIKCA